MCVGPQDLGAYTKGDGSVANLSATRIPHYLVVTFLADPQQTTPFDSEEEQRLFTERDAPQLAS
jgi:hypothetical protein